MKPTPKEFSTSFNTVTTRRLSFPCSFPTVLTSPMGTLALPYPEPRLFLVEFSHCRILCTLLCYFLDSPSTPGSWVSSPFDEDEMQSPFSKYSSSSWTLDSASDGVDPIAQWTYFNVSHLSKPTQKILWLDLTLVLRFSISVRVKLPERAVSCFPSSLPHLPFSLRQVSFVGHATRHVVSSSQTRDQTFALHRGTAGSHWTTGGVLSGMYFYWGRVNLLGGAHMGGVQLNELS